MAKGLRYNKPYTLEELRGLSMEKLLEISKRKYPGAHRYKGRYTKDALLAQKVYEERSGKRPPL